jgi:hypothetical protein
LKDQSPTRHLFHDGVNMAFVTAEFKGAAGHVCRAGPEPFRIRIDRPATPPPTRTKREC